MIGARCKVSLGYSVDLLLIITPLYLPVPKKIMRVSTHHDPSNGGPAADLLSRASSCNTTPVTSLIQPLCCRQDDVSFPRVHIHFNLPTCSWSSFLLAVSLWQILSFHLTACSNLTVQYCWGISLVAVTKYFFGGKFFLVAVTKNFFSGIFGCHQLFYRVSYQLRDWSPMVVCTLLSLLWRSKIILITNC